MQLLIDFVEKAKRHLVRLSLNLLTAVGFAFTGVVTPTGYYSMIWLELKTSLLQLRRKPKDWSKEYLDAIERPSFKPTSLAKAKRPRSSTSRRKPKSNS